MAKWPVPLARELALAIVMLCSLQPGGDDTTSVAVVRSNTMPELCLTLAAVIAIPTTRLKRA
jgi:hypothetical protein